MRKLFAIAIVLLFIPSVGHAWNDHGHMTVAAIAFAQLSPAAKTQVGALLRLNPSYAGWTDGVDPSDRDKTAFINAATWPDAIKGDPAYENDGSQNGNVPPTSGAAAQSAARNIGYSDHLRHKYWHFIDLPFSPDGTPLAQPPFPNALTQIRVLRSALKTSTTSDEIKSYDLVWLEHLIGDVHQPLHATSRFTHDLPDGDAGGNLVSLCDRPNCRAELHAFWDNVIGTSKTVSAAIKKAGLIAKGRQKPPANLDEMLWINESFELAKSSVYVLPIGPGKGPYTIDPDYKVNARALAYERIWLAGNRLAGVINDALK